MRAIPVFTTFVASHNFNVPDLDTLSFLQFLTRTDLFNAAQLERLARTSANAR